MMKDVDGVLGVGATAAGSVGLTVQVLTQFGSLLVVGANLALAVGGLYLLYLRVKKTRAELNERVDRAPTDPRP